MTRSPCAHAPRGRLKICDLAPGETYYAVCSPTGVCIFRTRNEDEAREVVAKNPSKLDYTEHVR